MKTNIATIRRALWEVDTCIELGMIRSMTNRYMYNPEKTAETIDEDGWMHSGDMATFDADEDKTIPSPRHDAYSLSYVGDGYVEILCILVFCF